MGNKKNQQHIVPRTYLKHWCIPNNGSFVYAIDFLNKYRTDIQIVGVNDKLFKREKYYNDNYFKNPYIIEDVLGEVFEPNYEIIMSEIKQEGIISQSTCEKIIGWLYVSKMRSPVMRDNPERVSNFIIKTKERLRGENLTPEQERAIESYSRETAKRIHLSAFADLEQAKKLIMLFVETLVIKKWRILKSVPGFDFWTNDNPGFSPNVIERFAEQMPFHPIMEMNADSIIFFPLSPKHCLELTPFKQGDPLPTSAEIDIKFQQATFYGVSFINRGIFHTRNRLIISNNKASLENYIR